MSEWIKGPWNVVAQFFIDDAEGSTVCVPLQQGIESRVSRANLIAAAPELLEEAKSTDQGWDWFREQLENFALYQGSWSLEVGENWADSMIAHVNSRQIGTKAAIAKAEGQ